MSVIQTPEEAAARKRRNLWIALAIGGFIVLVFAITVVQVQQSLMAGAS